jgi:hypothetical protein
MDKQTLNLKEAAEFLGFKGTNKLRLKAYKGLIPACKPGRDWVFYIPHLEEWMKEQYASRREAAQVGVGGKLWQSSRRKVESTCTPNSHSVVSELMNLRKQLRSQKHKSTKKSEDEK